MMQKAVLAVLLLCGGTVLFDFFNGEASRHFDVRAFQQEIRQIFSEVTLQREEFTDAGLLPDDYFFFHVHDRSEASDTELISIYVGYYPFKGLGTASPHDPQVCYPVQGYELLGEPVLVPIVSADSTQVSAANRLVVRSNARSETEDDERVVYYWVQQQAELPSPTASNLSALAEVWTRYQRGRSDLIWVRIELRQADRDLPLDADWRQRLMRTMMAAAAAMK